MRAAFCDGRSGATTQRPQLEPPQLDPPQLEPPQLEPPQLDPPHELPEHPEPEPPEHEGPLQLEHEGLLQLEHDEPPLLPPPLLFWHEPTLHPPHEGPLHDSGGGDAAGAVHEGPLHPPHEQPPVCTRGGSTTVSEPPPPSLPASTPASEREALLPRHAFSASMHSGLAARAAADSTEATSLGPGNGAHAASRERTHSATVVTLVRPATQSASARVGSSPIHTHSARASEKLRSVGRSSHDPPDAQLAQRARTSSAQAPTVG